MPRRSGFGGVASAFERVQQQARALVSALQKQISEKENELKRLREEQSRLSQLVGASVGMRRGRPAGGGGAPTTGGAGRIDWRVVLKQLPKQFRASDVRDVRGLKNKRPSEIFAAITRWIDAGLAKRKARGVYERA